MKSSIAITLAAAKLISAHATFQSFVVDGEDQGQHYAVRTPSNYNNPIYDVTSSAMVRQSNRYKGIQMSETVTHF
jgi:lytic cellulose monooxygenase (C1-hydroxylating)